MKELTDTQKTIGGWVVKVIIALITAIGAFTIVKTVVNFNITVDREGNVSVASEQETQKVFAPVQSTVPPTTLPQFVWLEEVTPMAFYSKFTDSSSWAGKSWKWDREDLDNTGETHEHGVYFSPVRNSPPYVVLEYSTTKYSRISGTLVLTQESKNKTKQESIEVYIDDDLVETIKGFRAGFTPRFFEYDLSGSNKIIFMVVREQGSENAKDFGIVNGKLYY